MSSLQGTGVADRSGQLQSGYMQCKGSPDILLEREPINRLGESQPLVREFLKKYASRNSRLINDLTLRCSVFSNAKAMPVVIPQLIVNDRPKQ